MDKLKQHNQQIFFVVIPPNSQDFGHHKIHQAPPPVEFTSQFSSLKSVSGAHLSTALLKVFSFADTKLRKVSTPTARAVALEPSTDNHPTAFPHTTHQKTLISSKTALSSSLDETVTAQKTYENLRRILLHLSEMYPISSTPTTMAVLFCTFNFLKCCINFSIYCVLRCWCLFVHLSKHSHHNWKIFGYSLCLLTNLYSFVTTQWSNSVLIWL